MSKVANHHAIQSLFHLIHTQLICLKYNSFNRRKSEQKGKGGYMWTAKRFNSPGSMAHIKPNKSSTPQEILGEWLPKILKTVTSMSQRNTGWTCSAILTCSQLYLFKPHLQLASCMPPSHASPSHSLLSQVPSKELHWTLGNINSWTAWSSTGTGCSGMESPFPEVFKRCADMALGNMG